jgi:hypothetical protein
MEKDILIIKKETFSNEDYMKPLKVSTELHTQVKQLADEANQPISKISCMLVEFALARVKIED